ncbi:MAG TPA: hypothetical protein VMW38_20330 [Terriglobia bacterium]|nr:hypothetical protein [Terriglobia bacterium]
MKIKTSVTLSQDLLGAIDGHLDEYDQNRSLFMEAAARLLIAHLELKQRDARDAEILRKYADEFNREAKDALLYQVPV